MPRTKEPETLLHPEADQAWFQSLPAARQADLHTAVQANRNHTWVLAREQDRRRIWGALAVSVVFGVFDYFGPEGGFITLALAMAVGGLLGMALEHLRAARLLTASCAIVTYLFFEWISRGGLSGLHMFLLFPVGALCAVQGLRRENGE